MDILLDTIRGEIAICLEKAYEKISLKDVARMLYLPNEETAKNYGVQVRIVTFFNLLSNKFALNITHDNFIRIFLNTRTKCFV